MDTHRCELLLILVFVVFIHFRLDATTSLLREREVDTPNESVQKRVAEILVRKVPDNQEVSRKYSSFTCLL